MRILRKFRHGQVWVIPDFTGLGPQSIRFRKNQGLSFHHLGKGELPDTL